MAQISIVRTSELEGKSRIDAEYYRPHYLEIKRRITSKEFTSLSDEVSCFKKGIFDIKASCYSKTGIPFVRISNLKDMIIDETDLVHIPENEDKKNKKTHLIFGDVILSKTAIPAASFVSLNNCNVSQDTIAVKLKKKSKIKSQFLVVFLNSKYGLPQMLRYFTGNIQSHLNLTETRNIVIPLSSENIREKVGQKFDSALEKFADSREKIRHAKAIFTQELGVGKESLKHKLTYTIKKSDALKNSRIDAGFFQPAYSGLVEYLCEHFEVKHLNELLIGYRKGIEIGRESYDLNGKLFVRVSNLSPQGLVYKDQKYVGEELYQKLKDDFQPKVGDLLLTKDATPGIAYVVKEPIGGIISSGIMKLDVNEAEINKEYLAFCINSIVGKTQIERYGGGSVITHWRPDQIEKLLIPKLSERIQQKIASLVKSAYKERIEAKELLEEAKSKVEKAVEK